MPLRWPMLVFVAATAAAQKPPASPVLERHITFSDAKPLLGLPESLAGTRAICSSDGLVYFAASRGEADGSAMDVYTASAGAEVKRFRRAVPTQSGRISIRDFFASEHSLVTLLEVDQPDERDPSGPPRERQYFLSVSDHAGDESELLPLDVKFIPLRVALLGSGEYILLGWERGNELPKLAVLKEDGTLRRFIDFDDRGVSKEESLAEAQFVPFGSNVMLTYPGTTRPILVVNASGVSQLVPIAFPAGYVLRDVLVSGPQFTIVARFEQVDAKKPEQTQRISEFSLMNGVRLREFTFANRSDAADVRCAANGSLTSVYRQAIGSLPAAGGTANGIVEAKDTAQQWVISSVHR